MMACGDDEVSFSGAVRLLTTSSHKWGWANWTTHFWNVTLDEANDFTSQLRPASDISVDAVMTSLYFNAIVFVFLLACYEVLRRILPSVYSAKKRNRTAPNAAASPPSRRLKRTASLNKLPDSSYVPLDWVAPVFGVSWSTVRKAAGLDAYFFLRFIRMCVRITAVSTFWAAIILAPAYATGNNGADGWYRISMTNIQVHGWRMWIPVIFIYLFSTFTFFVLKQEFSHFMDLRMDFLGREESNVDPQHHFSIIVENIPDMLRSDHALRDYFEKLFPGKVHSASVIIRLPDMEALAARGLRVTKRLEKAIAVYHATGERPVHMVAQSRVNMCGMDIAPFRNVACGDMEGSRTIMVTEHGEMPPPGSRVDSISFYTRDLAECNREMRIMQQRGANVAENGSETTRGMPGGGENGNWFVNMSAAAADAASTIMDDSELSNNLRSPHDSFYIHDDEAIPQAENMSSRYGSFGPPSSPSINSRKTASLKSSMAEKTEPLVTVAGRSSVSFDQSITWSDSVDSDNTARLFMNNRDGENNFTEMKKAYVQPFARSNYKSKIRRWVGRLGLDFLVSFLKYSNRQVDMLVANVVGVKHSSTGFVTFLDLRSVSTAASTPLTHKPNVLQAQIAPEPRDIRWKSAYIPAKLVQRRENYTNIFLSLGIVLWSIPLTAIQVFATPEKVSQIPGMEWVVTVAGGRFTSFINGYLPVVALLCLIMILPIIFEYIAVRYEHRKTLSDVQRSMLGRFFYYQLANIYLTVTAGSLWQSLADILESPRSVLEILGQSLPKVVGYFISLLITKILAGLPIIVLRVGALGRMLLLRATFAKEKLTQREMDGIYRRENLLYGWEYPSQLLVIVICFTYVCICPIILPFGAIFFVGSLMVYKKQALYVYTPLYESGGAMFPAACDCLMFGLTCSQTVLIGYTVIRQCFYEPFFLMPLPFITIWIGRYFRRNYAVASKQLSMERAMERDRLSDLKIAINKHRPHVPGLAREERRRLFEENSYRQPALSSSYMEPMQYRRSERDEVTEETNQTLRQMNEFDMQEIIQRPSTVQEEVPSGSGTDSSLDPLNLGPGLSKMELV